MNKLLLISLLLLTVACGPEPGPGNQAGATPSPAQSPTPAAPIPYSVALEGFTIAGFPGLHSAVVAGAPEKLILLGGRRNGMHGFPPNREAAKGPAFPKTEANDTIYVRRLRLDRCGRNPAAVMPARSAAATSSAGLSPLDAPLRGRLARPPRLESRGQAAGRWAAAAAAH